MTSFCFLGVFNEKYPGVWFEKSIAAVEEQDSFEISKTSVDLLDDRPVPELNYYSHFDFSNHHQTSILCVPYVVL